MIQLNLNKNSFQCTHALLFFRFFFSIYVFGRFPLFIYCFSPLPLDFIHSTCLPIVVPFLSLQSIHVSVFLPVAPVCSVAPGARCWSWRVPPPGSVSCGLNRSHSGRSGRCRRWEPQGLGVCVCGCLSRLYLTQDILGDITYPDFSPPQNVYSDL